MISQTAEYALRAVVWMATTPGASQTTQQIAAATRVPPGYLAKVLQSLGRAGLVTSQRGLGGGFTLARPAQRISALEVINAVDPVQRIRDCPLGIAAHGTELCPLHSRLDRAMASVEKALGASKISEMIDGRGGARPLCGPRRNARRSQGRAQ